MDELNPSLLEETLKVWQPYYKEPLTKADAMEIHHNFTGFFELLLRLDKKINERKGKANNN